LSKTKNLVFPLQKPDEILVENDANFIIQSPPSVKSNIDEVLETMAGQQAGGFKASPARDALAEFLDIQDDSVSNDIMTGDTSSLIVDLNDLLKRDPTLSSLSEDTFAVDVDGGNSLDFLTTLGTSSMEIPKTFSNVLQVPNNSPATWTSKTIPPPNRTIKPEVTTYLTFPSQQPLTLSPSLNTDGIKMETNDLDIDDIDALFMKNSSPNVSFGVGPNSKPLASSEAKPSRISSFNPNFWQANDDSSNFSGTTNPWSSALSSSVPTAENSQSSVTTSYNISPLSDILTDLSSTASTASGVSPNLPSNSPSQAGPTRHSTLHKLLMRKDPVMPGRPSPVRSPDGLIMRPTRTLEVMRNSLSASNPLISQQGQLSTSAPVQSYMSETSGQTRIWSRREPRQHISSVCSVGEASSLADEVNAALSGMDPNDLQDIASDDEDDIDEADEGQNALQETQTTEGIPNNIDMQCIDLSPSSPLGSDPAPWSAPRTLEAP
jgi:hypothetical protein